MRCRSLPHLRRHLAATLDLTLWCLGCDVRHPAGNLLAERGFARVRPPHGHPGATMYTAPHGAPEAAGAPDPWAAPAPDSLRLTVWGFGLFVGCPVRGAGLLLRRHDDAGARLAGPVLPGPLWTPDALPPARVAAAPGDACLAAALLDGVAALVAEHEVWVWARCGPAYRPECAAAQPRHVRRRQRLGVRELVAAWHAASDGYARLYGVVPHGARSDGMGSDGMGSDGARIAPPTPGATPVLARAA